MTNNRFKPHTMEQWSNVEKLYREGVSLKEIRAQTGVSERSITHRCAKKRNKKSSNILFISDLHAPYHHRDALDFLRACKKKYNFKKVVCTGDELDFHAMSFHDSDPDLDNAGDELEKGRKVMWELEEIFPQIDLVHSNHGSMAYRRAKHGGIPRKLILSYRDAIFGTKNSEGDLIRERGNGWVWHDFLTIDSVTGPIHVHHGISRSTQRSIEKVGANYVQGHFHGVADVVHHTGFGSRRWGMTIGCLIDDESMAYAYNKTTADRPVLGCGALIDGEPRILPMYTDKNNRWIKF